MMEKLCSNLILESMRHYQLFVLTITLLFAYSCEKTRTIIPQSEETASSYVRPLEDALSDLDTFLSALDESVDTKTVVGHKYEKEDVMVFGKKSIAPTTKSIEEALDIPDSLLYIVNFTDNGYAVLSGDARYPESIHCVVDSGQISMADSNNAMSLLQEGDIIPESLVVPSLIISASLKGVLPADNGDFPDIPHGNEVKYGPFVLTKWNQQKPFNDLCNGNVAGCCTIAVGQIIVANRVAPSMIFDGVACTWNDLCSVKYYTTPNSIGTTTAQNQVAHFIKMLRSSSYCNISGTSGDSIGAKRALKALGYNNVTRHWGFGSATQESVKNCLSEGHPVYVDGLQPIGSGSGHCWVIDGYYKKWISGAMHDFHHINWGWGGKCDGYYNVHDFDVSSRQFTDGVIDSQTASISDPNAYNDNYTWDIWTVTYTL